MKKENDEELYPNSYKVGPFYRKGCTEKVWFEVNKDGQGGLWFHIGNCENVEPAGSASACVHFSSVKEYEEFITKLSSNNSNVNNH